MFSLNEIYKARCICSSLCSFCFVFLQYAAIKFRFTNDSVNTTERKNKARISEQLSVKIIVALLPTQITTNCLLFCMHEQSYSDNNKSS